MSVGQLEDFLVGEVNTGIRHATAHSVSIQSMTSVSTCLHDNILRLLHILDNHAAYTFHFTIADVVVIDENAGNV